MKCRSIEWSDFCCFIAGGWGVWDERTDETQLSRNSISCTTFTLHDLTDFLRREGDSTPH